MCWIFAVGFAANTAAGKTGRQPCSLGRRGVRPLVSAGLQVCVWLCSQRLVHMYPRFVPPCSPVSPTFWYAGTHVPAFCTRVPQRFAPILCRLMVNCCAQWRSAPACRMQWGTQTPSPPRRVTGWCHQLTGSVPRAAPPYPQCSAAPRGAAVRIRSINISSSSTTRGPEAPVALGGQPHQHGVWLQLPGHHHL